jgi:hypothetical protein
MRIAILLLAGLTLAACSARSGEDEGGGLSDTVGDWSTDLEPRNNSGIRGTSGVQSLAAGAGARVSIRGAMNGAHHPWHVHRGTCSAGGGIVGEAGAYPPLHVGTDGTAAATATLNVALNEEERYHVNVHRSATEMSVIVACGDLRN